MSHIIASNCIGCGACLEHCPVSAIVPQYKYFSNCHYIIPYICTDCGACVGACPVEAISPEE